MKVALIDNHDSFTYNIVHMLRSLEVEFSVLKNDELLLSDLDDYDKLILSPGPKIPSETENLFAILKTFHTRKSILGICLGHQAIAEFFGATLYTKNEVFHGIQSEIQIVDSHYLFHAIEKPILVGRYHSWSVSSENFPSELKLLAIDSEQTIMAIQHRNYDVVGIQFHPESILTPLGITMIHNFIEK